MVNPHGGKLIERFITAEALSRLDRGKSIVLTERLVYDALMIAMGGFSPLEGFMDEGDYDSVVEKMHLSWGPLFAIPIVLPVDKETFDSAQQGDNIIFHDAAGTALGCIEVSGKFMRNLEKESEHVYGTPAMEHPGVQKIHEEGPYALSGEIHVVRERIPIEFPEHFLTPAETRAYCVEKEFETVVAFQTRNPIHRAHEYLTKVALEMVDGLMIHPIVGEVKPDDIPADTRMDCYKTLIQEYYNPERVLLNILPMAMRYAGPREAIHHAIIRQNYGMSHLIVGRDHAGVGSYYGTYDAQKIFDQLGEDELEIRPLKFEHAFFCRKCGQLVTAKTCPHDKSDHVFLSGTKVREKLRGGEDLPQEFTRLEISHILQTWIQGREG